MEHSKALYEKGIIKNKEMLTQSQYPEIQFLAKIDNIKTFFNSLKSIHFNDDVNIVISDSGFKAIVENLKYVQASMYVDREYFSEYHFQPTEEISLRVNLSVLCDCLSVFNSPNASLKLIYKGDGAPLVLLLEQHGIDELITECSIKTKNGIEPMEFTIDETDTSYNMLMILGPEFFQLLNDINKSAGELEIFLSPNEPHFKLTVLGVMQTDLNIQIAKTSGMIVRFLCQKTTKAKYKMSHIRMCLKALNLATKVAIRTDSKGLLALQIMVLPQSSPPIYIEFFVLPLVDEYGD